MAMPDPAKHPEFKGAVHTVDTPPFQRTLEQSPSKFGYHWNHNGETHYLIGEAMGEAMIPLMSNGSFRNRPRKAIGAIAAKPVAA